MSLFSPIRIGTLELPNKIVMAARSVTVWCELAPPNDALTLRSTHTSRTAQEHSTGGGLKPTPGNGVPEHVKIASEIGGDELFSDELHSVRSVGRVVWCVVSVPERTPAAAGAAAAQRAGDYLVANVLQRRSPWLGLILDVRRGPSVFGPITRSVTVRLLESAESTHKPFSVLTGGTTTQHAQYESLAASHAPQYALVTSDVRQANDWMTAPRIAPP